MLAFSKTVKERKRKIMKKKMMMMMKKKKKKKKKENSTAALSAIIDYRFFSLVDSTFSSDLCCVAKTRSGTAP
uniref:Uncharacterized protein n=1 Tax=Angiostrongylus cantonensis TaxID=6313 RepID=A0A0K0DEV2_ANGCA